jgi:ribosome biogenesis protein MAK21
VNKGTSKDKATAGALLVSTNPLSNIPALESLIALTKHSNKTNVDVFDVVTDLFVNSLLPSNRKLIPLENRSNDWKALKNSTLDKAAKDEIYAYWFYESELKDQYHGYLLNIQASLQNGKEASKVKAIIAASKLLKSCPEREGFLLSVLVNKFGDPDKKIASKVTYNLRQILMTHPNMTPVMVAETEKLIFRNNITELAQHYGIGFLSLTAPLASVDTSQKLVNICLCFFKIKIEKGDINSKTMQAILHCLRRSLQNINEDKKKVEITTPDVVNTIYRLIYLSNISIAFQALSLLLQLTLVQDDKHDRYYNALYRKMVDPDIISASSKITSLYFHIIHQSIQQDSSVPRAKAFIKRLLQMTLSFPPGKACGALIVINKILKYRPELMNQTLKNVQVNETKKEEVMSKFDDDSDDEEVYKDAEIEGNGEVKEEKKPSTASWIHVNNADSQKLPADSQKPLKYDAYKRSAAFCGSEYSLYYELLLMSRHFHPTVQVFVESILKCQKIKYFGDPLKDFSLSHFLERFSFKNPKKTEEKNQKSAFHQDYKPKGSRGTSVHLLTAQTCTEDEKFIFEFLQRKREIREKKVGKFEEKDDDVESVDDDEFDAYLDSMGAARDLDKFDKDFDYLSDLQKDPARKNGKAKEADESDGEDDWGSDEGDSDDDGDDDSELGEGDDGDESGSDQSLDMSDEDGSEMDLDESDEEESNKLTSGKKQKDKKKKKQDLFVAVDDFSEMIEKNSSNTHGTLGEIFNKDKSSQKQMDWEQKRHNSSKGFKRKKSFSKKSFGPKTKKKRY